MSDQLPEGWEAWLAYFAASMPRPVEQSSAPDGSITFRGGSPGEVIVHLTPNLITVSLFTVRANSSGEAFVVARPVGYIRWRRLLPETATRVVDSLIAVAREARLASYRVCERCERTLPPESMADDQTCAFCAARPAGSVH